MIFLSKNYDLQEGLFFLRYAFLFPKKSGIEAANKMDVAADAAAAASTYSNWKTEVDWTAELNGLFTLYVWRPDFWSLRHWINWHFILSIFIKNSLALDLFRLSLLLGSKIGEVIKHLPFSKKNW